MLRQIRKRGRLGPQEMECASILADMKYDTSKMEVAENSLQNALSNSLLLETGATSAQPPSETEADDRDPDIDRFMEQLCRDK